MSERLARLLAGVRDLVVHDDVVLSEFSQWRIGGPARAIVAPRAPQAVADCVRLLNDLAVDRIVVGSTSNLLFDSRQHDEVILHVGEAMSDVSIHGGRVTAQAGVPVPTLARLVGAAGLGGIAHAVGVPGTLGGLVLMNGGTQRKGIGSNVVRVAGVDRDGEVVTLTHDECAFSYRRSALQDSGVIVTEVELELEPSDPAALIAEMDEIIASRAARFPLDQPSGGSTFLSSPHLYDSVGPPGKVIESVGLKGARRGGAQISERHANFIVNLGGASSDDVLWLIALARKRVHESTGEWLECEVRYISPEGLSIPAHVAAEDRWTSVGDRSGVGP